MSFFNCNNIRKLPFIMVLTILVACADNQVIGVDEAVRVSQEMMVVQRSFEGLNQEVQLFAGTQSALNSHGMSIATLDCVKLEVESNGTEFFPASYILDYGDGCKFGEHIFSGILSAEFSGFLDSDNTSVAIVLENTKIDGHELEGNYKITNKGLDEFQRLVVEHQIENGQLLIAADELNFGASIIATLIESNFQENPNGFPEIIETTWQEIINATFVDSKAQVFSITTESPIINISTWPIPVAGVLNLENSTSGLSFSIDFGNSQKDKLVTITSGDQIKQISL